MLASQAATSGSMTRSPGRPVSSNTVLPSGPTTFETKIGLWWMPPLAIVAPMFAISSGVIEITPSVKVSTLHWFSGCRPATLGRIPIFWAMSMTLSMPTPVDRRTNAQFTDFAVWFWIVSIPPSPSPPALVVDPWNPRTPHGAEPLTTSLREYPFWSTVANVTTLKLDPTWRPAPSTARLNLASLYGRL